MDLLPGALEPAHSQQPSQHNVKVMAFTFQKSTTSIFAIKKADDGTEGLF